MSYFIKICGITNQTDLDLVISLPVDGVGFNLYENCLLYTSDAADE